MKKTVLLLFVLLVTPAAFCQTAADITGKWEFSALAEKSGLKASEKPMYNDLLKGSTYSFNADKTYSSTMLNDTVSGTWELNPGKIKMTSESGNVTTSKIIAFEKDKLTIKKGEINIVLVKKVIE